MVSNILHLLLLICFFKSSDQRCKLFMFTFTDYYIDRIPFSEEGSKLNCDEINLLLDRHNECRELVASGQTKLEQGKDLWVLKWDKDLAKVAQDYANNCIYKHNKGRPKNTGENLSWKGSSRKERGDLHRMATLWYEEIKDYDPAGPVVLEVTGHFTQMVWGDTQYVGCGVAFYDNGEKPATPYQTLLVCNYKPPGNYPNQPLYKKFENGRCDRGVVSKKFPSLCAHDVDHANGNYVPCSGLKLQPAAILLIVLVTIMFLPPTLYK